jgi:hypothetical protein
MNSLRPFLGLAVLFHSTLPFTSWLESMTLTGNGGGRYIVPLPDPEDLSTSQVLRGKSESSPS